jgi:hypothetical protein
LPAGAGLHLSQLDPNAFVPTRFSGGRMSDDLARALHRLTPQIVAIDHQQIECTSDGKLIGSAAMQNVEIRNAKKWSKASRVRKSKSFAQKPSG